MTKILNQPLVSIVIPTYNQAQYLKECLDSVIAQSYDNWEAIVVNNYSEDDTIDVVESYHDERIKLVNYHNYGCIAASRNEAIRQAKGELVAFLDSDDLWEPDKLKTCVKNMIPEVGLVCHQLRFFKDGQTLNKLKIGPEKNATFDKLLYRANCLTPSAVVVRNELLEKLGSFNEDDKTITAEDYDLWLKLAQAGVKFKFVDEVFGKYRLHSSSASKSFIRQMEATFAVVNKYFPKQSEATLWERIKIRRRRALIYYDFARALQKERNFSGSLALFRKSFVTYPLVIKLYLGFGVFLLDYFTKRS